MFLRILFTLFLISILNEICYTARIRFCRQLSSYQVIPTTNEDQVVVRIHNVTTDLSYISITDKNKTDRLVLIKNCDNTEPVQIVDSAEFLKLADVHGKKIKNLSINFAELDNRCIYLADIKEKIVKLLYPTNQVKTLYVDLSDDPVTTKKAIKKKKDSEIFYLLDNCKIDDGSIINSTEAYHLIADISKRVQTSIKIEFPSTNLCRSYDSIAGEIFTALQKMYAGIGIVDSLSNPIDVSIKPKASRLLQFDGEHFFQVPNCNDDFKKLLKDATQVEDVVNQLAQPEIKRVKDARK